MSKRAGAVFAFLILLSALVVGVTDAFAAAPTLAVDPTPTASYVSAEVSGTVDPADNNVFYFFQYSKEPATEGWRGGPEQFTRTLAANSGPTSVSERLTGLTAGTEYQVRLVAVPVDFSTEWTSEAPYVSFETEPVAAPTMTIDPATLNGGRVQLSGSIDPNAPEAAPTSTAVEEGFKVEWHFECTPECPGLKGGTVAADNTAHTVQATSTELQPNTHYEATLIGVNAAGPTTAGPVSFTTGAVAPSTETVPAFAFGGGTRASLAGRVDAKNSPTEYWFEYGTTATYGQTVPAAPASAGSGREIFVTQDIASLTPSTLYHYRLIAESAAGRNEGEDLTFETAPASTAVQPNCPNAILRAENNSEELPACRAYEMVSPLKKNGYDVGLGPALPAEVAGASTSTPGIVYQSFGAFPGSRTGTIHNYYLGRRGPKGWTYDPLSPPIYPILNPGEAPGYNLFSANLERGYLPPRVPGPSLSPDESPGTSNLFVRDTETGTYQMLNVGTPLVEGSRAYVAWATPDGSRVIFESQQALVPEAPEGVKEVYEWFEGRLRLASILPDGTPADNATAGGLIGAGGHTQVLRNIISDDGSKVFFGATAPGGGAQALYVRVDGSRTVMVAEGSGFNFYGADASGSSMYFSSIDPLTPGAGHEDLYRFAVGSESLIDISQPISSAGVPNGRVGGVLGISEDGSYVYFYEYGEGLLPGGPSSGIYEWHAGRLTLVSSGGNPGNLEANLTTARVTSDGKHVVFTTGDRVTAYESRGASEVYLFDADTGRLSCASCRSNGQPPTEGASTTSASGEFPANPQRSVSADGSRVFFNTVEALVPTDINHRLDVYAWEDGAVHLISSGTDASPSYFSDASASGDDVYFVTRDQLVNVDTDSNTDIYDARVNGGFSASSRGTICAGEQCQGGLSTPPPMNEPGSGTVQSPKQKKRVSRNQKLQKAIKSCKRKNVGKARERCIANAHKRYGKNSIGGKK